MKEIWLLAETESWEVAKEMLKDAIEIGFDGAVVSEKFLDKAKKLGRIKLLPLEKALMKISSADDQLKAVESGDVVILKFEDWKVIPLENIVAMKKGGKVIAAVDNTDDAKLALTTLEKGADGIAVRGDREELMSYYRLVKEQKESIELLRGKIVEIKPLGVGERVCIDTVTLMTPGEGMLVGNRSAFMFLVASESEESEYVASRPFRVNAGSVNAYLKVGNKTKYLAELKAGDGVEIVRYDGKVRESYVGRVKIERRPLILVKASVNGEVGSIILQNAETIKLIAPDGKHISVSELKEGDEVLIWIGEKARHFGVEVDEFIVER
ncbi:MULTISPECIES: 3-dehydroquinate synthase II [unclassified Archaeoglobus]|jgi:3-dehydroquinate synthase II|uniref:3-dehydroquinate synthase II n=1 Tax=unclassified Archaeoglobus TaxID=2643606 RepID=UPI0025BC351E|nr:MULTISPECIES: 3-dehydroquinate synthase II [unclassified Archaeoglobus]